MERNIMFLAILCDWFFFLRIPGSSGGGGGHSDTGRLAPGHPKYPETPGG